MENETDELRDGLYWFGSKLKAALVGIWNRVERHFRKRTIKRTLTELQHGFDSFTLQVALEDVPFAVETAIHGAPTFKILYVKPTTSTIWKLHLKE